MNRWAKKGALGRVFKELRRSQIVRIKIDAVSLDSTIVKVHLKRADPKPSASPGAAGPPGFIGLPRTLERR